MGKWLTTLSRNPLYFRHFGLLFNILKIACRLSDMNQQELSLKVRRHVFRAWYWLINSTAQSALRCKSFVLAIEWLWNRAWRVVSVKSVNQEDIRCACVSVLCRANHQTQSYFKVVCALSVRRRSSPRWHLAAVLQVAGRFCSQASSSYEPWRWCSG